PNRRRWLDGRYTRRPTVSPVRAHRGRDPQWREDSDAAPGRENAALTRERRLERLAPRGGSALCSRDRAAVDHILGTRDGCRAWRSQEGDEIRNLDGL